MGKPWRKGLASDGRIARGSCGVPPDTILALWSFVFAGVCGKVWAFGVSGKTGLMLTPDESTPVFCFSSF